MVEEVGVNHLVSHLGNEAGNREQGIGSVCCAWRFPFNSIVAQIGVMICKRVRGFELRSEARRFWLDCAGSSRLSVGQSCVGSWKPHRG